MSRKKEKDRRKFHQEFASELTPDVNGGASSRMHQRFPEESRRSKREDNSAPDDVEWGPSVRGHDFRVN